MKEFEDFEDLELPRAARIVGVGQILLGGWAMIEILIDLTRSNINFNLTVILLFTGFGLLNRREWAPRVGRVVHIIGAVLVPTCFVFALIDVGAGGNWTVTTSGGNPVVDALLFALSIGVYAFVVWGIFVLGRADVIAACRRR